MNRRVWLTLLLGLLIGGPQLGFARFGGPQESFTQCLLRLNADGDWELSRIMTKPVYETHVREVPVQVQVEENGKTVTKTETQTQTYQIMRTVSAMELLKLDPNEVRFFAVNGTGLAASAVKAGLQKPRLILVSQDGKIHPSFATLFKPGTIVMSAPPERLPVPQAAPPLPPQTDSRPTSPKGAERSPGASRRLQLRLVGQEPPPPAANPGPTQQPVQIDYGLPSQPPPTFKYCKFTDSATVSVRAFNERKIELTSYKDVNTDGVLKKVPISIKKTLTADVTDYFDRSEVRFLGLDGKPLSDSRIAPLSQREAAVVVSANGAAVDPFWLQNINPGSIVLTLPVVAAGHGPGSAPTAPPSPAPVRLPPPATAPDPASE